jgi:thymidylate synthase
MLYQMQGGHVNNVNFKLLKLVQERGKLVSTDRGEYSQVLQVYSELTNPRNRWLSLENRNSNIYATIAEIFWIMSGSISIDPWLSRWLPRAAEYSDNGSTWYSGYGQALVNNNALQSVLDHLEDKDTRKAVLSIYDPARETTSQVRSLLGKKSTKDNSCNNLLYFYDDDYDTLSLQVTNRSNDLIFGYPVNVAVFTFLQECVALLSRRELGRYGVYHNNVHVYKSIPVAWNQYTAITSEDKVYTPHDTCYTDNELNLGSVSNAVELTGMFSDIIYTFMEFDGTKTEGLLLSNLEDLLGRKYDIDVFDNTNILNQMIIVLLSKWDSSEAERQIPADLLVFNNGLQDAIVQSGRWMK